MPRRCAIASAAATTAPAFPNASGSPSISASGSIPRRARSIAQATVAPNEIVSRPSALQRSFAFETAARSPTPHCEPIAAIDSNSGPPYFGSMSMPQ